MHKVQESARLCVVGKAMPETEEKQTYQLKVNIAPELQWRLDEAAT